MRRKMKALSPIVATILIVAVTLAIAVGTWLWLGNMIKRNENVVALTIADISYARTASGYDMVVKLHNSGTTAVTVTNISLNGKALNATQLGLPITVESGQSADILIRGVPLNLGVNSITVTYTTPDNQTHYLTGEFYVG